MTDSSGVSSVTIHQQRESTFTSRDHQSTSLMATANMFFTRVLLEVSFPGRSPVLFVVFSVMRSFGAGNSVFGRSARASVMNLFQAGAAQLIPSQLPLRAEPSTFPAHTTVVMFGLHQTVQVSPGRILEFAFLAGLLAVPVLAATIFPGMESCSLQKGEFGLFSFSERIVFMMYAAAGENTSFAGASLCSSRIRPSESSIRSIK